MPITENQKAPNIEPIKVQVRIRYYFSKHLLTYACGPFQRDSPIIPKITAIVNEQVNLAGEIMIERIFTNASKRKREATPKNISAFVLLHSSGSIAIIFPPKVVGLGFSMGADLNIDMRPVLPL